MHNDLSSDIRPGSHTVTATDTQQLDLVRTLAEEGRLAQAASTCGRKSLGGSVYAVAWPIVFARLTRQLELRRGHPVCARAVHRLAPECLDRFHDDVEAVVEDTLRHADRPIHNLEAWIASRLTAATVDGHRRRRGSRGALQRPRAPKWLCAALGDDPWLVDLAVQILVWSGVPTTAGAELWPLDAWAQRRAGITGDSLGSNPATVRHEVGEVLAAMRARKTWYADYVERPLGRKEAPVCSEGQSEADGPARPAPLALTEPDEVDDAVLTSLAAEAIAAIRVRLDGGEAARTAVAEVIGMLFGEDDAGRDVGRGVGRDIDRPPHCRPAQGEIVTALLRDPAEIGRITSAVLAVLDDDRP